MKLRVTSWAWALFCSGAFLFPSLAQETPKTAPPMPPAGVLYQPDLEYGTGAGEKLKLDLARPEKLDKAAPCVVVIHGGAWRAGDKRQHTNIIFQLAQQGYVAATIQYRLVPKHRFPAQVEDVKCAVRYLRASAAEHKLNPEMIGAIGFSAGAHLSMMLGTMSKDDGLEGDGGHADQSSRVQCVVAFFGPTDMERKDLPAVSVGLLSDFVGTTPEEDKGERKRASPITYLDQGDAPILIFQGTKDKLIPTSQALVMADAMTKAGVPGRVELLIGADHGWGGEELIRTWNESLLFFSQHLKPKPVR
ncbi:Carboxylesterase NlhH [Anatilimnocola aggregata]|uniref:Carboxylesterase NlhH n=1 Tax=Anatilimnocola aggregata TaxID=2528021 RepID=A0A517Y4U1_9BACT|nr:alpha/beta hydrolase [Anatilimnocola aggregata]QDU25216.1 Carboxylesterase NlhH [Anatilimnocola aggregata]